MLPAEYTPLLSEGNRSLNNNIAERLTLIKT